MLIFPSSYLLISAFKVINNKAFPLGLFGFSIPLILTEKGVSFGQLGVLTLMAIPYALKLFVAPVVDSVYQFYYLYWRINFLSVHQIVMEGGKLFWCL